VNPVAGAVLKQQVQAVLGLEDSRGRRRTEDARAYLGNEPRNRAVAFRGAPDIGLPAA
jgi:hypothetical protein